MNSGADGAPGGQDVAVLVRREDPDDIDAVRAVVTAAFAPRAPGSVPVEVALLDRLRADPGWLPTFSLVVGLPGAVVGHVVCTRGRVGDRPALGLGPLAVAPTAQRRGVGSALMTAVLGAAEARGESLIALLGDPAFYGRFGFRPATEGGVTAPDPSWGGYFQVRRFGSAPTGPFAYAAPFDDLG